MTPEKRLRARTLTKSEMTERLRAATGLSWAESGELIDATLEIVKETLEDGGNVKVSGFGSFLVRQKAARRGRNPQTSERILIAKRRVLTFKPSLGLRAALNAGDATE
jgi:integration host factor subunit alpha